MPQFIDSIEYTDTEGSKVALDGITSVSTVDASTLSVASATNIIPDENGAVNPLGRKADGEVGVNSTALGYNSTASGDSSTALGYNSTASGDSSTALGDGATASSENSTALGYSSSASSYSSTAVGYNSTASDMYSTALGYNSKASGRDSTALGYYSNASGTGSMALGDLSKATNISSVALGGASTSSALYSVALGGDSTASGNGSVALGRESTALGTGSVALGSFSTVSSTDSETMQLGDTSLSALRCVVNLTVTSDKRDKTDIEDITNALAFVERLNPVTFVSNDREYYISDEDKKGETFRTYGMCEYDRVSHAAGTKKGERRRCGLLAQEVVEAMQSVYGTDNYANVVNDNFHDLTNKPSDVENKYTLAYANLVPFLIGAIKELNAKIKILEGKLATSSVAGTQED